MNLKGVDIVYIGIVPDAKGIGKPFRTDIGKSYPTRLEGAKYRCEINGGRNKYFYIEERYFLYDGKKKPRLGNIKQIHHYNQEIFLKEIKNV